MDPSPGMEFKPANYPRAKDSLSSGDQGARTCVRGHVPHQRRTCKSAPRRSSAVRWGRTEKRSRLRESSSIRHATARFASCRRRCRCNGNCKFCRSTGSGRRRISGTSKSAGLCFDLSSDRRQPVSEVVYVSKVRIERKVGPLRIAYLPGESQPVMFQRPRRHRRALQSRSRQTHRVPLPPRSIM